MLERMLLSTGLLALPIYAHLWLLTHRLERGRRGTYAVGLAAVLIVGALLDVLPAYLPLLRANPADREYGPADFFNAVVGVWLALLFTTALHYLRRGIVSHFQLQQLRAQQFETELSLLKAQVNQHFLFNTLNNLYGLSLAAPEQMPEALLQLAGRGDT